MSSVWLAEDPELERLVAIKLLSPAADRARFEREARAAASLSHPNLCALYDYGESDGKPYMVLEYLPNGSLEERLKAGTPLPDAEVHRIATEIASGLAHAHGRGLGSSRSQAGKYPLRQRGTREDRRLRHRANGRLGHADRSRDRARNRVVHLARAGKRGACRAGQRRLFVRRHPLSDAHRPPPIHCGRRNGGRPNASRRPAADRRRASRRRAHSARTPDRRRAREGSCGPSGRRSGVAAGSPSRGRETRR